MVHKTIEEGFKIDQILECGQCFRYTKIDEMHYELIAFGQRLRVKQDGAEVYFDCSEEEYEVIWHNYFDFDRDYPALMRLLASKDKYLKEAVTDKSGTRILNQDPFEMILCFIISQNKSIPQIKVLVQRLCETYGKSVEDRYGSFYAFPSPQSLKKVTEDEFRALKVGFRGPYLKAAVDAVNSGSLILDSLYEMDRAEARARLTAVKGIGNKVADCILLFGYGKSDVFPIDVWVRRIMTEYYFDGEKVSDKKILDFADDYYGDISGLAQQYLFFHGRDKAINSK